MIAKAMTLFCAMLFLTCASAYELKLDAQMRIEKAIPESAPVKPEKSHKVLIYTRASGFVHGSIPLGAKALEIMGKKTGAYDVTKITDDPAIFDGDNLKEFDAIVLMSTTGNFFQMRRPDVPKEKSEDEKKVLNKKFADENKLNMDAEGARKKALLDFVAAGKGIVGIHAATDAYYNWPEYGEMIGGFFNGHPWGKINVKVDDATSPLTAQFDGKNFDFSDEIYTYKTLPNHSREKLHVLLSVDLEKSGFKKEKVKQKDGSEADKYQGENRADHDYAVAWIKKSGQGRVFYTLLGHNDGTFQNPLSMKFFLAGMQYALGDLKADDAPSVKK